MKEQMKITIMESREEHGQFVLRQSKPVASEWRNSYGNPSQPGV